ncbi:Scaffold-type E3 ligase [Ascochyta clinopodiicola]|nr:Scaffold-type E3 ligase [Ascochyta clinopodiicola]
MFGASEDRARQLAGRQRWKRISSSGSTSSRRSVSSLSQVSHWETSSIFEQNIQRPMPIPEHHAYAIDATQDESHNPGRVLHTSQRAASPDAEVALSRMMANDQHPQTQQQRRQAEHLSQVLYNDTMTSGGLYPSTSHFVLPTYIRQHGPFESITTIFHRLRNASEPIPQTYTAGHELTTTSAHNFTSRSVSTGTAEAHTIVSMRGGADHGQTIVAIPVYTTGTHWIEKAQDHPSWEISYNSGIMYRFFLDSLPRDQVADFILIFGHRSSVRDQYSSARRLFFYSLDSTFQLNFKRMIMERAKELLGFRLNKKEHPLDELRNLIKKSSEGDKFPPVCLPYLVEATLPTETTFYGSGGGGGGGSNTSAATKATLNKLFDKYREDPAGEPDAIGVEGTMSYLPQLEVDLEGMESLAALEIIQAPTMGEITRDGFVNGWLERDCDTIEKQKAYIKNLKTQLPTDKALFTRVYKYTFFLAKTGQQKGVALDSAILYWDLLFASPLSAVKWSTPSTPWLDWWKEFLNASWKKSINKDMWNETLKFAQLTLQDEAISFWNEESSWPSVIDDFVEWVKNEKRGGREQKAEEMEY